MSTLNIRQSNWLHSLMTLLQQQRAMVDELVTLGQSQAALIAEGRTDRLLDLLAKRQALIDGFTTSQSCLAELSGGLDERMDAAAPHERDRIKMLINEIGERLSQVMKRDEEDQKLLRSSRDQVVREMAKLGTARQARGAYRAAPPSTTRFKDQHG
jgi:hypothetical protein